MSCSTRTRPRFVRKLLPVSLLSLPLLSLPFISFKVYAQAEEPVLEEVISIGTRSTGGRTLNDSPVPVDLISADDMSATGATEVGRMLQSLAPSFNFSSSTISDGTDALRPATLRGLGPD